MDKKEKRSVIIPFGKYKGQPAEVLAADTQYLDWLAAQPWFRERYRDVYNTIIVNNFREPADTPEHNQLQALFLDDAFCIRFLDLLRIKGCCGYPQDELSTIAEQSRCDIRSKLEDIAREIERYATYGESEYHKGAIEVVRKQMTFFQDLLQRIPEPPFAVETTVNPNRFERGCDVLLEYYQKCEQINFWNKELGRYSMTIMFAIEVKPSIGDDYPAVLRQMRAFRFNADHFDGHVNKVLFLGEYVGKGANMAQFLGFFRSSGIEVIFREELDS